MRSKIVLIILSVGLFFCISGCAAKVPPPLQDISNAKIALANAKDVDAQNLAPKSFELAQKNYNDIKFFMAKKEYKSAQYAAQKAHIQAKLAAAYAKKAKVQKRVDKLSNEVNTIKKEFTTISE
jgi:hypothetical protein